MSQFSSGDRVELQRWRSKIVTANRNNVFCHCRQCDREWVASDREVCTCGSEEVETIACWQFPDG